MGAVPVKCLIGLATVTIGSRAAAEHATYLIEAADAGIGGGQAGDRVAFPVFFDPHNAPVNYEIFGPRATFTGRMIEGEITIVRPQLEGARFTMRILACADLHGRRERIARVRALVAGHRPDIVVLPGDLTHAGSGDEALELLALSVPVLAIPGNMDGSAATDRIGTLGKLDGIDPVTIAGVSFGGPAAARPCDVLVTHEPPFGILDAIPGGRHIGSTKVRELLGRLRPRVLLCGHVHESPGIERAGDTLVINCTMGDGKTGGALIELTAHDVQARLL